MKTKSEPLYITTLQEPRDMMISSPPFQAVLHTIAFNVNQDPSVKESELDMEKAQKVQQQLQDFGLEEGKDFIYRLSSSRGHSYVLTSDAAVAKYHDGVRRATERQAPVSSRERG